MVKIPTRLHDLLPPAALDKVLEVLHQPDIAGNVREALNRVGFRDASPLDQVQEAWQQARSWLESISEQLGAKAPRETSLINASGRLFGEHGSVVPQDQSVAYAVANAATQFVFDEQLSARAEHAANHCLADHGSDQAVWLNSFAAATFLLARVPWAQDGFVISRTDAIRLPGFGDIRDMLGSGGLPLREVGAANGAERDDWTQALAGGRRAAVVVSPNGAGLEVAARQRAEALAASESNKGKLIEILIDGVLNKDLVNTYGFSDIKQASRRPGLTVIPLDALLGGPTGAVICGEREAVEAIRKAAHRGGWLMRGSQLVGAALTLQRANLGGELVEGVTAQLLANAENLRDRCRRMAVQLNGSGRVTQAVEFERKVPLGASPWQHFQLDNWAVRATLSEPAADVVSQLLHPQQSVPILVDKDGQDLIVDLRFVPASEDHHLVRQISGRDDWGAEQAGERTDNQPSQAASQPRETDQQQESQDNRQA